MNTCNNRRVVFSVLRSYKKDKEDRLRHLSSGVGCCSRELREPLELAVGRIIEKKWHEKN
jgi:hypothetical protein